MKFWLFLITKIEYQNILIAVLHESKAAIFVQEEWKTDIKKKLCHLLKVFSVYISEQ